MQGSFVNEMEKKKFLIPCDISMSQLVWIIRKRVHMEQERALYIYLGKTMPLARYTVLKIAAYKTVAFSSLLQNMKLSLSCREN